MILGDGHATQVTLLVLGDPGAGADPGGQGGARCAAGAARPGGGSGQAAQVADHRAAPAHAAPIGDLDPALLVQQRHGLELQLLGVQRAARAGQEERALTVRAGQGTAGQLAAVQRFPHAPQRSR